MALMLELKFKDFNVAILVIFKKINNVTVKNEKRQKISKGKIESVL